MDEKVEGQCFCQGAGPQLTAIAKSALPTHALEHFKASQVEFLKGIRHLLDAGMHDGILFTADSHKRKIR